MPSIVGRESELHVVDEFVRTAADSVLAIVGEPGIGKTTVWMEAVDRAAGAGHTVLSARPAESEALLSFSGLADLLASLPDAAYASLPEPQRNGLDAALLRAEAIHPPDSRVVGTALANVLTDLAAGGPVVLAIDDVQWLDRASGAAIEFALRRLRTAPVFAIVSLRSGAIGCAPVRLDHDLRVRWVELDALSVGALHRVLADTLGRTFSRPTLVHIADASGGNPLHALEIARLLMRTPAGDLARLPVPTTLDALVRTRVRALPAGTRRALLRAAAVARPDTRIVDESALATAEDADLVRIAPDGRIRFVHPLFASAVYAAASAAERRATHRALANVVADREERARHLALAVDGPDERVVAEIAAAARSAQRRGAPHSAAELTELALRHARPGSDVAYELQLDLAERLYLASDFERARAVLEEMRAVVPAGAVRARTLLALAEIEYWQHGESAALALAEEALAVAHDPVERARCLVSIAAKAGTVDLPRAAAAAEAAVELLEGLADAPLPLLAAALSTRIRADIFLGLGFDAAAAERALALESSSPPPAVDDRVVFKLGQWLRYTDDLAGARARLLEAEAAAHAEGDDSSLANILLNRVITETWAGDWSTATDLAERMIEAFEQQGAVVSRDIDLWRAYVEAHRGRRDAVEAAAARAARTEPIIAAVWSRALGLAALAHGDAPAADDHLRSAHAELEHIDFREPAVWRIEGDAIEAAVAVGDLDRAEQWCARFEACAARSAVPWSLAVSARCRGLLHAARGDLDASAAVLERAVVEHARCPVPFEFARTLLVQGQVLRRLKRKRQARVALEDARTLFERLGAEPWVARADAELQRVAVRKAPNDLSPTELRIARLAAEGWSNPEIAAAVFVSRKTVEANLARAYRKLGIASRAQLARALDRHTEPIS